jgi:hypothetical protein
MKGLHGGGHGTDPRSEVKGLSAPADKFLSNETIAVRYAEPIDKPRPTSKHFESSLASSTALEEGTRACAKMRLSKLCVQPIFGSNGRLPPSILGFSLVSTCRLVGPTLQKNIGGLLRKCWCNSIQFPLTMRTIAASSNKSFPCEHCKNVFSLQTVLRWFRRNSIDQILISEREDRRTWLLVDLPESNSRSISPNEYRLVSIL